MPSFQLAGVTNFCYNLLSRFLSIVRIFSSRTISFQILRYALFPWLAWSIILPFPSYLNFYNLKYLGNDASRHMTIPPQKTLNDHILNLHINTHPITKNISRHPINQSHPTHIILIIMTLYPTQPCLIRNSKFPRFTRVQQNSSSITLINLFLLLQR